MNKVIYAYPGVPSAIIGSILVIAGACSTFDSPMVGISRLIGGVILVAIGLRQWKSAFLTDSGDLVVISDNSGHHEIRKDTIRFIRMRQLLGRMEVHQITGDVKRFALPVMWSGRSVLRAFPEFDPKKTEQ